MLLENLLEKMEISLINNPQFEAENIEGAIEVLGDSEYAIALRDSNNEHIFFHEMGHAILYELKIDSSVLFNELFAEYFACRHYDEMKKNQARIYVEYWMRKRLDAYELDIAYSEIGEELDRVEEVYRIIMKQ